VRFSRFLGSLVLCLLLINPAAWALADGWYSNGGLGLSRAFIQKSDTEPRAHNVGRNDIAYKATMGYQWNENFASEFSYLYFSRADYRYQPNTTRSVTTQALSPDFVFILPMADRFTVNVRVGFFQSMVTRSKSLMFSSSQRRPRSQFGFNYGIGADYAIAPSFALGFDWDQLLVGSRNAMLTFNVIYHFNT